jgi:hypothetical protein
VDPGVLIAVGFLWFLLNVLGKKRKPIERGPRQPPPNQRSKSAVQPPRLSRPPRLDPTQREGARLQDLLRDLGKTLESATEGRSLEEEVRRPERVEVDTDDEAEAVVARRRAAAEANARPLEEADHQTFDARIRQEPADATSTKGYSVQRLRDAVVWREILGPPVSLRDPFDS